MIRLLGTLIVLAPCAAAMGNTGVFTGSGQTIKLVHTSDVQMVSEDVTILPGRGLFLFDGTVPGMDRVEYRCKFVLKNLSKKTVSIQVGFPLDSEFFKPPSSNHKLDATDAVMQYKFIARDHDKTYHVRFVPTDAAKHLTAILLWDMDFRADESRELQVAYEMPISMALAPTNTKYEGENRKQWYGDLESAIVEQFGYVTETARSWAGPVESAEIHVRLGEFEKYLQDRRILEESAPTEGRADQKQSGHGFPYGYRKDYFTHRRIEPGGWTEKDGTVTWTFKGRVPDGPVSVSYWLVNIPQSVEGLQALVQSRLIKKAPKADAKADDPFSDPARKADDTSDATLPDKLADLREIILASWGIKPTREKVLSFVSDQIWYAPDKKAAIKGLTPRQREVLSELDRLAKKAHH